MESKRVTDSVTSTADLNPDLKMSQDNILLTIVKELCCEDGKLSAKLKGKVTRIMADCNLTHYSSLHRMNTVDESTTTLLGFMQKTNAELTYDEQAELNQAIIHKIEANLPKLQVELDKIKHIASTEKMEREEQLKDLQNSLNYKLDTLEEQENEKVELMMEWLNHRLGEAAKLRDDSSEMLTLKAQALELKAKMLHLNTLQNIFSETNQSIKSYEEIHKDLEESIKETEERIKGFKEIVDGEFFGV